MHWRIKGLVFKILENVPGGDQIHYWFQRRLTRSLPQSAEAIDLIWQYARETVSHYQRHDGKPTAEATLLEFGAGRDLAYALSLKLLGFRRVLAIDLNPLAKIELVQGVLAQLAMIADVQVSEPYCIADLSEVLGLEYRAPMDARCTGLPANSIQCVVSRDTMEHIPRSDLALILRETHRILEPRALLVMLIDYADHYSYVDAKIGPFNFLTFSERSWRKWNSAYLFQNRLRHADYIELFGDAGFEILEEAVNREQPKADLVEKLVPPWGARDPSDVFAVRARIVARKP